MEEEVLEQWERLVVEVGWPLGSVSGKELPPSEPALEQPLSPHSGCKHRVALAEPAAPASVSSARPAKGQLVR